MCDLYDRQIWKDFNDANKFHFFTKPSKYGLMLNLDWFCPCEQIRNFSVGVFYLVVLNLPRHIRFCPKNVIIGGIIPRFSHEPLTNTFVVLLVEGLKKAWNEGFECCSMILKKKNGTVLS